MPTAPRQQTVFIAPPSSLLTTCAVTKVIPKKGGAPTVMDLASAYVENTTQLGTCNKKLDMLRKWSDEQKEIHEGK